METVRKQKAFYNKDFRYFFREIIIQLPIINSQLFVDIGTSPKSIYFFILLY